MKNAVNADVLVCLPELALFYLKSGKSNRHPIRERWVVVKPDGFFFFICLLTVKKMKNQTFLVFIDIFKARSLKVDNHSNILGKVD